MDIGSGMKSPKVQDAQILLSSVEEFPGFRKSSIEVVNDRPAEIFAVDKVIVDFVPVGGGLERKAKPRNY